MSVRQSEGAAASSSDKGPGADRWEVGLAVSYVLASGRTGRGIVFAVDAQTRRVVLDVENNGVLVLNLDHVTDAAFEPSAVPVEPLPSLTAVG